MTSLPTANRAWVLKEYAKGPIHDNTFKLEESPLPDVSNLPNDHILVKVLRLAFEPSMRPSISLDKSYREPHPLNTTIWAIGIGQVVGSNSKNFAVGSKVAGLLNMQEYALIDATKPIVRPYEDAIGLEHISILGPSGMAAHLGLFHTAQMKKGDVVICSAAAGATGSIVVQLARAAGASKVIGIASKSKCDWVVKKAGADACLDYNSPDFESELHKVTEDKVNVYFDNVGGPVTDAVLGCMARKGRIAVCGAIGEYQKIGGDQDAFYGIKNWRHILLQELTVTGFIRPNAPPEVNAKTDSDLKRFLLEGKIKSEIYTFPKTGIEYAIEALLGLFTGQNLGKMTLEVASD